MTDSSVSASRAQRVLSYLGTLQNRIVTALEAIDGGVFVRDEWLRPQTSGGGGGTSCLLENSAVFERAGVGMSHVRGLALPPSAAANRPHLNGLPWQAMGVSLVLHPRNPHIPTVHMNVRFFIAGQTTQAVAVDAQEPADGNWWFGGGMDLTPYYGVTEDVVHFHRTCRDALAPFESEARAMSAYEQGLHASFKKWCDDYFWLKHRNEARGVGGVFFDDFDALGFERSFELQQSVGNSFLDAYLPLVQARKDTPYTQAERDFQSYRRGRYVEFNLVFDRGTLFGLQSGGRTESILMSMPPNASWRYDWQPDNGSAEAALYTDFLPHREWI